MARAANSRNRMCSTSGSTFSRLDLVCYLDARGDDSFHAVALQLEVLKQALKVPRIGFVLEARGRPPDDAVEYCALFVVIRAKAESASHRQLVEAMERLLEPFQVWFGPVGRA